MRDLHKAHKAVHEARRRGRLIPGPCAHGGDCKGQIEAHHHDYDKPLDVLWLCERHHKEFHHKAQVAYALRLRNESLARSAA